MIQYRRFSREIQRHHRLLELGCMGMLALLVFCNYYGITRYAFVPQDFSLLAQHAIPLPQITQSCQDASESLQSTCPRPLSRLLLFLTSRVWQWGPRKWHSVNLLLHLVNVLGVYLLGRAAIGSPVAALVAGSVFALHPGHLGTLLSVAGVMELAGTTCILFSVLSFFSSHRQGRQRRYALWYRLLSLILYGCAVLIYELALFLPVFFLLYELIIGSHREPAWQRCRQTLPYVYLTGGLLLFHVLLGTWENIFSFSMRNVSLLMDARLLARPLDVLLFDTFWGHIVLFGICLFVIAGFVVSQSARFAILWTGGFLLSATIVSSAPPGYLGVCGLSLLIGEILAGAFPMAHLHNLLKYRHLRTFLQTSRIIFWIVLCVDYGFATEASKDEWYNVTSSTEQISLFMKSLHPVFPENARLCFDTLPSGSGEDWKYVIQARYPAREFSHVQIGSVERCVKEGRAAAVPTYAFRYQPNVLTDITREIAEKETVADIEDISLREERILSKQHPQVVVDLRRFPTCHAFGLVSLLGNAREVPQGTTVARGFLEGYDGQQHTFTVAAGEDTAEWAIRFSTVAPFVQHGMPPVYAAWTVRNNSALEVAQNYCKTLSFDMPVRPTKMTLELSTTPLPDQFSLDVRYIICYR